LEEFGFEKNNSVIRGSPENQAAARNSYAPVVVDIHNHFYLYNKIIIFNTWSRGETFKQ